MFGGRRTKKALEDLKEEHQDLEVRYDNLQEDHEKLQHEAGEETNIRISSIEEEIEAMNHRVEKLATDSYEIRSEVREIHESVLGMQSSLSDIVKLYKAILYQYGFGNIKGNPSGAPARPKQPGEDPGDAIIRALEEEHEGPTKAPRSRTTPPKAGPGPSPGAPSAPRPPPRPAPSSSNALDELHRLSEAHREGEANREEDLASRLASRSTRDDKVDRVARRDLGRQQTGDMDREGEFTRSLPKKDLRPRSHEGASNVREGEGWESVSPPPGTERRERGEKREREERRSKPKLEDLLDPE